MTLVDNREGMGANIDNGETEFEIDNTKPNILFRNIKIYGEHNNINPDCP